MCGQRIQTDRTKWTRVPTLLGLVLVGYICGRSSQPHGLHAAPPEGAAAASNEPPLAPPSHSDYSRRVVAYILG
ncbi:MAG: hypothetical protein NZ700_08070 [Gemmataceae bacterium]|nr:hypothetical protein [Gemmataceae bacterium]MDW8266515.1 hypothetical protein [Gemmataceae bacterium]